jgi:hypothetical protein
MEKFVLEDCGTLFPVSSSGPPQRDFVSSDESKEKSVALTPESSPTNL